MSRYCTLALAVFCVLAFAGMASANTWNYVADFNSAGGTIAVNPNGAWEYGHNWAPGAGGSSPASNLSGYNAGYVPFVTNNTAPVFIIDTGSLNYQGVYAAANGQGISARWTAPTADHYSITAWAVGYAGGISATTLEVDQVNAAMTAATQLWSSTVSPLPASAVTMPSTEVSLSAGDKIIFFIPPSYAGAPYSQFDATITTVPEPTTIALLGVGGCLAIICRRRCY